MKLLIIIILLAIVIGLLFQKYTAPKTVGISYKPANANVSSTMQKLNDTIAQIKNFGCSPDNKNMILEMISKMPTPSGNAPTCQDVITLMTSMKGYSMIPKDLLSALTDLLSAVCAVVSTNGTVDFDKVKQYSTDVINSICY
jgi:hypothetical protein